MSARDDRGEQGAGGAGRIDFIGPGEIHLDGGEFVSDRMLRFWEDWGPRPSAATGSAMPGSSRT